MGRPRWTAAEVKEKLLARHPATQLVGSRRVPGPWTCIEEWMGIDLLAMCAVSSPATGRTCSVPYLRVGYEVKVSRADYRSELKKPHKRARARASCHEFYFAVPSGLLHESEIDPHGGQVAMTRNPLYIPEDVGLVAVDGRGCKVIKSSPVIKEPESIIGYGGNSEVALHALIRWVSARPDDRHNGVVERAREQSREINAAYRRGRAEDRKRREEWFEQVAEESAR